MLSERLPRFDGVERALHWSTAALFLVLLATAAVLYFGELSTLVGRRELVRQVHVASGLLLPVPLLLALVGRWGRRLLADLRAFNRWDDDDRRWLRSWGRDPGVRLGKFNTGQKLNAAFVAGAMGVMLVTGSIMHWFDPFPLSWRTGATFVHDWTAIAIAVVLAGHVRMALADPDALRSMVRGWVPADWARRHRPRWYEEQVGESAATRSG
ncbi:MAG TPA: cytochrome b/b6 domain-containing protein [Acidimicrobiales bacterium]|nr:cytochrome b/b6 domain-containing protein [Acidimicrobiales bacterium]